MAVARLHWKGFQNDARLTVIIANENLRIWFKSRPKERHEPRTLLHFASTPPKLMAGISTCVFVQSKWNTCKNQTKKLNYQNWNEQTSISLISIFRSAHFQKNQFLSRFISRSVHKKNFCIRPSRLHSMKGTSGLDSGLGQFQTLVSEESFRETFISGVYTV